MFDYQNYPNVEELMISTPWSNVAIVATESGNNLINLGHEKLRWPSEAKMLVTQKGKKLIIEIQNPSNAKNLQVNFDIKAPKNTKLELNLNNSDDIKINGIAGNIAVNTGNLRTVNFENDGAITLNSGNIEKVTATKIDSLNMNVGNVSHAVIEDLQQDLHYNGGNGKLDIKFTDKLTASHHIDLNGGTIDFNLWAPKDTAVNNTLEAPPFTLNITSDFAKPGTSATNNTTTKANGNAIEISGSIGIGSVTLKAL